MSNYSTGAKATQNLRCNQAIACFSGELLWSSILYKFPQQPVEMVREGFKELGRRWRPGLDILDSFGVDAAFELHLQEDVHDGITWEKLKEATDNHLRCRQLLDVSHTKLMGVDELAFIETYKDEFSMHHDKDAEDIPDEEGKESLFTYQSWSESRAKYRSLGYGQIRFKEYYKILSDAGVRLPSIYEWEDPLMSSDQALNEGAPFLQALIDGKPLPSQNEIQPAEHAFDDFVGTKLTPVEIRRNLGLSDAPVAWDLVSQSIPMILEEPELDLSLNNDNPSCVAV